MYSSVHVLLTSSCPSEIENEAGGVGDIVQVPRCLVWARIQGLGRPSSSPRDAGNSFRSLVNVVLWFLPRPFSGGFLLVLLIVSPSCTRRLFSKDFSLSSAIFSIVNALVFNLIYFFWGCCAVLCCGVSDLIRVSRGFQRLAAAGARQVARGRGHHHVRQSVRPV